MNELVGGAYAGLADTDFAQQKFLCSQSALVGDGSTDARQVWEAMRERSQRSVADDGDQVVAASASVVCRHIGYEFFVVGAGVAQQVDGIAADGLCRRAVAVAVEPSGAPVGAGCERGRMSVVDEQRGVAGPVEGMGREQRGVGRIVRVDGGGCWGTDHGEAASWFGLPRRRATATADRGMLAMAMRMSRDRCRAPFEGRSRRLRYAAVACAARTQAS